MQRGPKGSYVAVSSRGNFFLTWSPGETYWQPHNRPTCGAPARAPASARTPSRHGDRRARAAEGALRAGRPAWLFMVAGT